MPTGFTVTPSSQAGTIGNPVTYTVTAIGGNFNPSGEEQRITATGQNSGDVIFVGTAATQFGPDGSSVTMQPDGNQPSFTFTIAGSVYGSDSIVFTNNQGWTNPSPVTLVIPAPAVTLPVDPFTFVAKGIVAVLNANPGFASLVQPGNIIDMTLPQFMTTGFKQTVKSADLPEVIVLQDALASVRRNSNAMEVSQVYKLVMTFDMLGSTRMNLVHFWALVALNNSLDQLGMTGIPNFCGNFIRNWTPAIGKMDAVGGNSDLAGWKRDSQRWVSAMSITVDMYFTQKLLNTFFQP